MTPPRLNKVEKKKTKKEKIVSFWYTKIYMNLYIISLIFLMILFLLICFKVKGPTYGWFGS